MANIIPMAGLGSRFSEAGYQLPKPLIPVSGQPMILEAIKNMPPSNKWIFLVRKEHVEEFQIDQLIKSVLPEAIIIEIDKTTEGQASTCMLAMKHVEPTEELFIAACDNSFLYDQEQYGQLVKDETIDLVVWTFTQDKLLTDKPNAWGWVRLAEDGRTISDMSVKVPVSDNPFNDHAVVASFYFKRASDFVAAYELMVSENYRINNEFYVDSLPIFLNRLGKRSVILDVDLYVGWGKPADLYEYEKIEYAIRRLDPVTAKRLVGQRFDLWQQYFKKQDEYID